MISERAFVDATVRVGRGCSIWHFAVILADVVLGERCSVGSHTEIGRGSTIGAGTRIGHNVFLPSNSTVGEDVFFGPGVVCCDDRHPRILASGETYVAEPPVIENGASIGAGAILLPGIRIGCHARIAAGAIVTRDVEPFALVRGEPARARDRSDAALSW